VVQQHQLAQELLLLLPEDVRPQHGAAAALQPALEAALLVAAAAVVAVKVTQTCLTPTMVLAVLLVR
jgi:hypothetical protein